MLLLFKAIIAFKYICKVMLCLIIGKQVIISDMEIYGKDLVPYIGNNREAVCGLILYNHTEMYTLKHMLASVLLPLGLCIVTGAVLIFTSLCRGTIFSLMQ